MSSWQNGTRQVLLKFIAEAKGTPHNAFVYRLYLLVICVRKPLKKVVHSILLLYAVKGFSGMAFDPVPDSQDSTDWYHARQINK